MAIITKIDGGKQAITFNNDTEPVAVYVDGQLQTDISFIPDTVEGNPLTYTSEYKNNLISLDIEGNTEQKQLTGKNLFDMSKRYSGGAYSTINGNSVTVSGAGTYKSANFKIPNWQNLLGKKITYSCNISNITNPNAIISLAIRFFNGNTGVYNSNSIQSTWNVSLEGDVSITGIINAPSDNFAQYPNVQLCVALYSNTNGATNEASAVTYSNIQIEYGDKPTEYEEYCGGIPSPNPQYPQEIQNADNMSVELSGINLFDLSQPVATSSNVTVVEKTSNYITVKLNNTTSRYKLLSINLPKEVTSKFQIGTNVVVQAKCKRTDLLSAGAIRLLWMNGTTVITAYQEASTSGNNLEQLIKREFTINQLPDFETYPNVELRLALYANGYGAGADGEGSFTTETTYSDVMVKIGEDAEYQPYFNSTVQIPTHLASQDKLLVNYIDKSVKVNKVTVIYQFTGNESFIDISMDGDYAYTCKDFVNPVINENYYCTHFSKYLGITAPFFDILSFGGSGADVSFYFVEQTSVEEFKAWLTEQYTNGTPVTIQYTTSNIVNTDYTGETWASDLLALPTQNATNIITINSNIPTSKLSVDYAEWGGKYENLS